MAGQVVTRASEDALMQDEYGRAPSGKASGKKSRRPPPKNKGKKGNAGPGPIQRAMGVGATC